MIIHTIVPVEMLWSAAEVAAERVPPPSSDPRDYLRQGVGVVWAVHTPNGRKR